MKEYASLILSDVVEPERYGEIAGRTRHIYELMRNEHPFLTSGEDSVFAAMLALSELTDEQIVEETEQCYRLLKPEFFSGNAVQSLSHVLALREGKAEDKCKATMELFHSLKARGCKYGTDYELATLGVLAMLPADCKPPSRPPCVQPLPPPVRQQSHIISSQIFPIRL